MIFDTIKTVALATAGVKSFGHGRRSYANLEQENEAISEYGTGIEFPRIWLYPVEVTERLVISGALMPSYNLLLDIADRCPFDASTKQIDDVLRVLEPMAREFILRMFKVNGLMEKFDVRRQEIIHVYDANLVGYAMQFNVKLQEQITYPCP